MKKYVIIGAGNGGQSLAGDMVLRGVSPACVYDVDATAIESIKARGGIRMSGPVVEGFAKIENATTSLKEAMAAGDVFLVCVTSLVYNKLATQLAPYVKPNHTYLLLPGYAGSSLMFAKTLQENGVKELPLIGEAISIPYATRLLEPAHAGIKARKVMLPMAAFPASRNYELLDAIRPAIFEATLGRDSLSVGCNNTNPISHVVPYLMNMDKVENPSPDNFDFHSWGTKTVQRLKQKMDSERCNVMRALGLEIVTDLEFDELFYKSNHYVPIPQKDVSQLPSSASQTPDRFIDEDIPMGVVPFAQFGMILGIPTPVSNAMIDLAGIVRERNFWDDGTSPEKMGLSALTRQEINDFVMTGKRPV